MAVPIRQLLSQTSYNANGADTVWDFSFAGGYLDQLHVKASKLIKATGVVTQIPLTPANFIGPYQLSISPALPVGTELTIYRSSPKDVPLVNFSDKAALTEASLDLNAKQAIFTAAESSDGLATAIDSVAQITVYVENANTHRLVASAAASAAAASEAAALASKNAAATSATNSANSATAAAASEAAALASKNAASSSATAAGTSATNASTSATNSANSATAASGSASTASTQAGNAGTSATNATNSATAASTSASGASTSATNANTARVAAEAALDSFDDRYLGSKAAAPTLDNDGAALLTGALYWDTVIGGGVLRVYNGSLWVTIPANTASAITTAPAGTLAASNVQAALDELDTEKVPRTSLTGSMGVPYGTSAQRDAAPVFGATRANSTLNQVEWWNGVAWSAMGGGATGAAGNYVFVENDQVVTGNYTLTAGKNAMTAGPITINNGVTVTVPTGAVWTIV